MTDPMEDTGNRRRMRRIMRDWRFWLITTAALYTLLGFVVMPLVAKHEIPRQTRSLLQCESSVKSIRFNPYTFNARVRGFAIADRTGQPLASFDEVSVNFSPLSLIHISEPTRLLSIS